VHAFAESDFAWKFLAFILAAALFCLGLVLYRRADLKSENELDSMVSRESSFLYNNLLFLVACFAVLWGTLFPVLSEAVQGEQVTVGPPFFNKINIPIGLGLLFLTGVGPLLAWRRTSLESLKRNFFWPGVAGVVTGVGLAALGIRHFYALTCYILSAFVLATIVQEFHKGTRARRLHRGGSYLSAMVDLTLVNTRRYGGYIVHVGMVLIFIGIAGQAFNLDKKVDMRPGDTMEIGRYQLRLAEVKQGENSNYIWEAAILEVTREAKPLGTYDPQRHFYKASEQPSSEVRRYSNFREDLYLVYAGRADQGQATIQVFLNPLVRWVWVGGIVMFLGTIVTMVPNRRELKLARREEERAKASRAPQEERRHEVA
jgi:cytochrome c-type biogenesis protein CcmF